MSTRHGGNEKGRGHCCEQADKSRGGHVHLSFCFFRCVGLLRRALVIFILHLTFPRRSSGLGQGVSDLARQDKGWRWCAHKCRRRHGGMGLTGRELHRQCLSSHMQNKTQCRMDVIK